MSIGKRIRVLRETAQLSQSDLGKIVGVTDKAVSTWENDVKIPRMGKLQALADYFDVPKSYIIDGVLGDNNKATFADRLRLLRNERGISQQDLAKQLGISKSSVNMYERGEREPGIETLEAIADYFNVDMDYLLGKSETANQYASFLAAVVDDVKSGRVAAEDAMLRTFGTSNSTCMVRLINGKPIVLLYHPTDTTAQAAALSRIADLISDLPLKDLETIYSIIHGYLNRDSLFEP